MKNQLMRQMAFSEIQQRLHLRALLSAPGLAHRIEGVALAYGAASRLQDRGANVILALSRRYAGNEKFQELCKAI